MGVRSRPSRHLALALSGALAALLAAAPPLAIRTAVKTLAAEAERHRQEPGSLPSAPDFASRADSSLEIDHDDLVAALTQRADRDPFTDAYIRWQLASLDPDLDSIDAKAFARLVREAPVPAANPRADGQVVTIFERVADAGALGESDLQRFRSLLERLETETAHAQALGRPATGFHEWVQNKVANHPLRMRQWLLVRLAMAASAGWPVAELKSQVTHTLGEAATDPALTGAHRALLARQLRALAGLATRAVDKVTFMADGSVRVTFSRSQVSDDNVESWLERLAG